MTRRTALTIAGLAPVAGLFGSVPEQMGKSVAKSINQMVSDSAREYVKSHTREYDPKGGMLGRGRIMSVDEALFLIPAIREADFLPYRSSWTDNNRFFPIYAADGGLSASIWHGFVRERNGKHEIFAVEHWHEHMAEFKARTGLTLLEAMEKCIPVNSLTDGSVVPVGYTRERWDSGRAIRAGVYDVAAYRDELLGK